MCGKNLCRFTTVSTQQNCHRSEELPSRKIEPCQQVGPRDHDCERYLAAATVYRAIFEEVDAKYHWVDGACDHYAQVIQRALDGYTNCVLATEPTPAEFDTYAGVIEARTTTDPPINTDQFQRALREFEDQSETERE